jgi:hypothetical protein
VRKNAPKTRPAARRVPRRAPSAKAALIKAINEGSVIVRMVGSGRTRIGHLVIRSRSPEATKAAYEAVASTFSVRRLRREGGLEETAARHEGVDLDRYMMRMASKARSVLAQYGVNAIIISYF